MFFVESDIKKLVRIFRDGPKIYGRAAAVMMNEMAFDMKNREIVDYMMRKMTVRSRSFVKARLRVKKAKPRSNINLIMSEVGSVADKPRFSGWREQELGKTTPKHRTMGLAARSGNRKKKARPSARMRAGRHLGPDDIGLGDRTTKSKRAWKKSDLAKATLVWTRREKYRKPFRLFGHPKIKAGLFQWKGKKLTRLQYFDRKKEAQPKRVKWLRGSRDKYLRRVDFLMMWKKAIRKVSKWK